MNKKLVINWHILEDCNFKCRYCFAHWPDTPSPEVWRDRVKVQKLLAELSRLPVNEFPPGKWDGVRLNLAGGEPMLLWRKGKLQEILTEARQLGFTLSIISNGYLMDDRAVQMLAPQLEILGISMDSADPNTNREIGRCGKSKETQQIGVARVAEIFRLARRVNPRIECKLNTVVNAANWREDFHELIAEINPDRWKVFQMLPIADSDGIAARQKPLKVTAARFQEFLDRHSDLSEIMSPEDNDEMTESYLMVDPHGRFYQNEEALTNYRHVVSASIHEVGVEKAMCQIQFEPEKFCSRYKTVPLTVEPGIGV